MEPDWQTVLRPELPALALASKAINATQERISDRTWGMTLLRAPSGEGKSTALRQLVAVLLAGSSVSEVLWCDDLGSELTVDSVRTLLSQGHADIVLAADRAETLIRDLDAVINQVSVPAGKTLQLLLAARDTDWTRARRNAGFKLDPVQQWQARMPIACPDRGEGVPLGDAQLIVQAWVACTGALPPRLRGRSREQAARELRAASLRQGRGGALLGALLDLRFGAAGLRAHLASLLTRLQATEIGADKTLASVLLILATAEEAGTDGIAREILAEFAEISESQLRTQIEGPLGREAVTGNGGYVVHIRHPKIARSILEIALSDESSLALESDLDALIDATVRVGDRSVYLTGYGQMFDIGRRLLNEGKLSSEFTPRVKSVAVGRCRKAVRAQPRMLSNRIALSTVLRETDQVELAEEEVWRPILDSLADQRSWADWRKYVRGAWHELATALGSATRYAEGVGAAAISLADRVSPAPITSGRIAISLNQLALNAKSLYAMSHSEELLTVVGAVDSCLRELFPEETKAVGYLKTYCRDLGISPKPFGEAAQLVESVQAATLVARTHYLDDSDLDLSVEDLRFSELERILRRHAAAIR